ncbi:UDP-N-acetylglucosamine--N-acetylmuramyl-(pentapeptide) pyrophosphoryl-undecaprenol N-acetylglucosamine transferase [hydrothermal vent metagenome]|uniref:UDP-N-acetylglucosamine--N-acetylmuramyl-(Pentapeptide) pyrophosphoryl-undecaprenol N-acetylglucosamine transferase n=1 Tax=hydrothermal vent metagenome TaxID=652676 RepID=A0A3B0UFD1_9ZZZZ
MNEAEKYKLLLSGGGTGGHIFPAIAIANGIKARLKNVDILFVGAKGRMEMEKVPQAGFPIEGLWISGIQRSLTLKNLMFPFKLLNSLINAHRIVKMFQPNVVVGTGGYASGPLLKAAANAGYPTLILEQNSYPGITNRWLGKVVDVVCTAYAGMEKYFPPEKIIITGSPIRKNIREMNTPSAEARKFFGLEENRKTLLIIGGSQGARRINEAVAQHVEQLLATGMQIVWQTGKLSLEMAEKSLLNSKFRNRVMVKDFIYEMDKAYAAADVVVSRAGAIAIAEIIQVGKPAVFIPLPSAAEDHQTRNAKALAAKEAALLLEEKNASRDFFDVVSGLMKDDEKKGIIKKNLRQFEHGDATEKIVEQVLKLIDKASNVKRR